MKYILKSGVLDGIFPGIGIVVSGQPVTPYSDEHEEAIKADGRFKVYRESTEPSSKKSATDGEKE